MENGELKSDVPAICSDLREVAADARLTFGSLSAEQLNWKPSEKEWSVAQCFDHLIKTHSLYFPVFERLAAGGVKASFWEKASPLSGYFGRFLIKSLDPANLKKMKTTGKAKPASSDIEGDIIEKFAVHQDELIVAIERIPDAVDPAKTIITSPLLAVVTYSLADAFETIKVHCQRHLGQAKRVAGRADFPAGF